MVSMRQVFHTDESAKVPLVSLVCAGFQIMGHLLGPACSSLHVHVSRILHSGWIRRELG